MSRITSMCHITGLAIAVVLAAVGIFNRMPVPFSLAQVVEPRTHFATVDITNGSEPHLKKLTMRVWAQYRNAVDMPGTTFRYLLNGEPLGPVLEWPGEYILDTSTLDDGFYVLSVQLLEHVNVTATRMQRQSRVLAIGDNYSPPGEARQIPVIPDIGFKIGFRCCAGIVSHSVAADYVSYPGHFPDNVVHPYPYTSSLPAHEMLPSEAQALGQSNYNAWKIETLVAPNVQYADEIPMFRLDGNGQVISRYLWQNTGKTAEAAMGGGGQAPWQPFLDGGRNSNTVSPYATYVADPQSTGWLGVDVAGRVFRVDQDGTVITIAGIRSPHDRVSDQHGGPREVIGSFENDLLFNMPVDLAVDPRDHNIMYIADTGNNRIAKIDFHQNPPQITTYAGVPWPRGSRTIPEGGYKDGPAHEAVFNRPYSVAILDDGTLYVADMGNHAIRRISPNGTAVSTIFGKDSSLQEPDLTKPQVIRLDSKDNIIVSSETNHSIWRVNVSEQIVDLIVDSVPGGNDWVWIDVDRYGPPDSPYGNVGPKDDILIAVSVHGSGGSSFAGGCCGYNTFLFRASADGERRVKMVNSDAWHYPWAIAIHDTESRVLASGFGGTQGVVQVRPRRQSDPSYSGQENHVYNRGSTIHNFGTVPGFPHGSRPAFRALHGPIGHSLLGLKSFDDLAQLSDEEIAEYIQSGMGGSVPRPEITGNDLRDYIYYIRRESLQGHLEKVDPGPSHPDTTLPVISNVEATQIDETTVKVTWQTNEPTLGLVHWGNLEGVYHGWSDIEDGYYTSHEVLIRHLANDATYHLQVRSKDMAGNQAISNDFTITLGDPVIDDTPPVITNVALVNMQPTEVTVSWMTDKPSTSQVEYGPTDSYGQATNKKSQLLRSHSHTIAGLTEGEIYNFRVVSQDVSGNEARSDNYVFVAGASVEIRAAQSGNWSDPAVWEGGIVPSAFHDVVLEDGAVVTYDMPYADSITSHANTILVRHGASLVFSRDVSTRLNLSGSLSVMHGGHLDVGTPDDPIPAHLRAYIGFNVPSDREFSSSDPTDPSHEPGPLPDMPDYHPRDIGIWVMDADSTVSFHGAEKPNLWLDIAEPVHPGNTAITLSAEPVGWRQGDIILLTPTGFDRHEGEFRVITGIAGTALTVDRPFDYYHESALFAYNDATEERRGIGSESELQEGEVLISLQARAALMTQNVTVASNLVRENSLQHRAHTMFMHGAKPHLAYTEFRNLGPRGKFGRYPIHYHKLGDLAGRAITGVSVWNTVHDPSNKWIAIHSTLGVHLTDSVGHFADSRGFFMEDADETGNILERNLGYLVHHPEPLAYSVDRDFFEPTDSSAIFWVREGNTLRDNVAVGGSDLSAGYWVTPNILGHPVQEMSGNEAHTIGHGVFYSGVSDLTQQFIDAFVWRTYEGFTLGVHQNTQAGITNSIFFENVEHHGDHTGTSEGNIFIPLESKLHIDVPHSRYDVRIGETVRIPISISSNRPGKVEVAIRHMLSLFPGAVLQER